MSPKRRRVWTKPRAAFARPSTPEARRRHGASGHTDVERGRPDGKDGALQPVVVDPYALFRARRPVCRRDDAFRHHVQESQYIEYGYRPLYELALPALGSKATLVTARRYLPNEAILDRDAPALDRRLPGARRADDSAPSRLPNHAPRFLAAAVQP